ncbi:hypothetical protein GLOIN_2v1817937 [Rhizophagus irregularis DAOM 181602=DAOM 197198]|nr:hypothetical protein GLOIN_2v1817937 [Rhizophagus irregularis DAOM 181602=DAOM 197198]
MSTETQKYIGHETLVSYIIETKSNNWTYYGFLSHNRDIIITSLAQLTSSTFTLAKWQSFDVAWKNRFLDEANKLLDSNAFAELKKKVRLFLFCKVWVTPNTPRGHLVRITVLTSLLISERSRYIKKLQIFWQGVIKEYDKENTKECDKENDVTSLIKKTVEAPANLSKTSQSDTSLSKKTVTSLTKKTVDPANLSKISQSDTSLLKKTVKIPPKNIHETLQPDVQSEILLPKKTIKVSETLQPNFELINFCYDILHELENTSYANLFYKCIKNDVKNNIINHPIDLFTINLNLENNQYTSLEDFEKDVRLIFCNCYTYNDVGSEIYSSGKALESIFNKKWNEKLILKGKQIKELKRTRDNDADDTDGSWKKQRQILEQNMDNLMYRQIVNDALLATSAYESLVIANESMLQAIVEILLPLKYHIPELSLVMDGKKPKGSGRFGYSDIFILKGIGDNYISLELKYISLVGLIRNQMFGANELENLDKILEKEDEEILLKRSYTYWSKEFKKTNQTTIGEVLKSGISQLESYMNTISKGKVANYSSSGVLDERVKTIKSNPNKLKGHLSDWFSSYFMETC